MSSTQKLLPIKEIKEGIVILKNGEWRTILMASSVNFALLSPDEQELVYLKFSIREFERMTFSKLINNRAGFILLG